MVAKIDSDVCIGCGSCIDECTSAAISLNDEDIAVVNEDKCLDCGACEDTCPKGAITIE